MPLFKILLQSSKAEVEFVKTEDKKYGKLRHMKLSSYTQCKVFKVKEFKLLNLEKY